MTNQVTIEIETAPGTWLDISDDVYQRDSVTISRGKSDEESQAGPQRMSFTLDNRDGKYSPRNPLSPLYGKVGRNTPVRCSIDNGSYWRFRGNIPGIGPQWDESHADNYIQVEAYGMLRRLGQGQPVVSNALRDYVLAQPTLAAYYPLSGGEGTIYSQNIAPGKTGSFTATAGARYTYGRDMGNAPWLDTGMELNATGDQLYMEGTGNARAANVALDFVFQSPAMGVLDVQLWPSLDSYFNLRLNTSADACTAQIWYFDDANQIVASPATGVIPALQDTELHTCRFQLETVSGPNIQHSFYIDGVLVNSGTNSLGQTLTRVPRFRFLYSRFVNQTVMNMAHLALWADNTLANLPTAEEYTDAAFAYAGETAIDRMARVCSDGGISLTTVGTAADSMPMGSQFSETRLEQIRDAEVTDMGILFESRAADELVYVSRTALYNQSVQFTLDYSAGQVSPPLEPVDDDLFARNDVTATRREAGSDRYTVDTGPLSTQDPPTGVGRYETNVTVNPETDGFLYGIAAWIANIGTLDQARWPSVTVNLASRNIPQALKNSIKDAEIGDRFVITGMRKAFVYDDVSLIIVGYTETITPFVHQITFNCMPAEPYTVGVWSTSASSGSFRWDTGGSSLSSSATATATSLSVATASGNALWTTDSSARPFDVNIGGERVRVTNVTGSSSPQTFTVTRSINGVVKAQTSGTDVRLWDTPRWAL